MQALFDLDTLLATAEPSGRWLCPVSNRLSRLAALRIDPWASAVLAALRGAGLDDVDEVEAAPPPDA